MQKDPFIVLGVTDSVTQNELYEAYRNARREWEGKRFAVGEEGAYACEKLDEIEQAYRDADEILKSRYFVSEAPKAEETHSRYDEIDRLIKDKKYVDAQLALEDIKIRDAKWHYLQSIIYHAEGRIRDSYSHLKTATEIEPENTNYTEALKRMEAKINGEFAQRQGFYAYRDNNSNDGPNRSYRDGDFHNNRGGMSPCDCCQGLICADCCCECMGGDLISCC
ncbi:MAG: hypothetical protein J6V83_01825 [Clostridia bacterium]|nr:hypothetical protein [Clostridia bacterium]